MLCKRGNTYKAWSAFYAVLSDHYLYLYADPEKVTYVNYLTLSSYALKICSESELGVPHAFKLTKRKNEKEIHYFYCADADSLESWRVALKRVLDIHS